MVSRQCRLERARINAANDYGYASVETRRQLRSECLKRCGFVAKDWQLDIAEALILKLDTVLIAGTGFGKTTPFVLPMMLPEPPLEGKRIILIISPLIDLMEEQVSHYTQHIVFP